MFGWKINDIFTFRNENNETQFIFISNNHYRKSFKKMLMDPVMMVAYKTILILKKLIKKAERQNWEFQWNCDKWNEFLPWPNKLTTKSKGQKWEFLKRAKAEELVDHAAYCRSEV